MIYNTTEHRVLKTSRQKISNTSPHGQRKKEGCSQTHACKIATGSTLVPLQNMGTEAINRKEMVKKTEYNKRGTGK